LKMRDLRTDQPVQFGTPDTLSLLIRLICCVPESSSLMFDFFPISPS